MATFANREIKTITFAKSRRAAELVAKYAKTMVDRRRHRRPDDRLPGRLPGGRAPGNRAAAVFRASCWGWRRLPHWSWGSTSEVMDAVVMNGFPGDRRPGVAAGGASRAVERCLGRGSRRPGRPAGPVLRRPPRVPANQAVRDGAGGHANPNILQPHLECAAWEKPITPGRRVWVLRRGGAAAGGGDGGRRAAWRCARLRACSGITTGATPSRATWT